MIQRHMLQIIVLAVGLALVGPAMASPRQTDDTVRRYDRVVSVEGSQPQVLSIHSLLQARLARTLRVLFEVADEQGNPGNGTQTVSDDPDPTSDRPEPGPGDPPTDDEGESGEDGRQPPDASGYDPTDPEVELPSLEPSPEI